MEFIDVINRRESCRDFDTRPVEKEKLTALIEAARVSPSACNSQPWHFTVVTEPNARAAVAAGLQKMGANKFTANCPAFIIVCERHAKLKEGIAAAIASQTFAQIDLGLTSAHICLRATDLGLSTCIVGWMDKEKLNAVAHEDKADNIKICICVGYAASPDIRVKKRNDTDSIAAFIE